jgi:histidyl-tRNA synthetase
VKDLGGPDIPGIGFAIGMERLLALLSLPTGDLGTYPYVFIAALGDEAQRQAFDLCNRLRLRGIPAEMDYAGKSLKSQMKRADKLKCRYALIFGERELAAGTAELRDMRDSSQTGLSIATIEATIAIKYGEEQTHRG